MSSVTDWRWSWTGSFGDFGSLDASRNISGACWTKVAEHCPKTRMNVTRGRPGCLFEDLKTAGQVRLIQGKDVELVAWRETVRRTEPRPGKADLCPKTSYWVFPAPLRPTPQRVERTKNGFLRRAE